MKILVDNIKIFSITKNEKKSFVLSVTDIKSLKIILKMFRLNISYSISSGMCGSKCEEKYLKKKSQFKS